VVLPLVLWGDTEGWNKRGLKSDVRKGSYQMIEAWGWAGKE